MKPLIRRGHPAGATKPVDEECVTGKLCWSSHPVAENYARYSRDRWKFRCRTYKCEHCRWWHVTAKRLETRGELEILSSKRK